MRLLISKYIIEHAQYHAIQTISTAVGYVLLNEALREVATECPMGRIPDNTTITAVADTWYSLPATFISVDKVSDAEGEEVTYYNVDGARIKFKEDGTYKIEYKRIPNEIAQGLESAVPEIPELFHSKLEFYIAARVRMNFNHEDGEGARLLAEFYNGIRSVNKTLSKGKHKKVMPAPLWR